MARAGLPSSEIPLMRGHSEPLFTPFSSRLGKGMLPLHSTSGFGFIFLWNEKGHRLLSRRKHWGVGGGWRREQTSRSQAPDDPHSGDPAREEAGPDLKKFSADV